MKKAAVINDLSGFGKCSLTAAIPVLAALGVQCCPLATAVLTGQTGYPHYHCTDLTAMMPQYQEAWLHNQASFDSIYSGYVTGKEQIVHVLDFLSHFRTRDTFVLVDPVMGDDGQMYSIFTPALLSGMKELSRQANLITPNVTEACLLTDTPLEKMFSYDTQGFLDFSKDIAYRLKDLAEAPQDIVITGIKCPDAKAPFIYNLALTDSGEYISRSPFYNQSFSGTGDLFASVICGCRTRGMNTSDAMELAESFLCHSIADTIRENTDRNDGIHFENHLIELINGVRDLL